MTEIGFKAVVEEHLSVDIIDGIGQRLESNRLFIGEVVDGHAVLGLPTGKDRFIAGAVDLALVFACLLSAVIYDRLGARG